MNPNHARTRQEESLTGDVNRFVHPDETRSDAQIAYENGVKNRLHMSGVNNTEEYWADYDELHGTVHGGQPKAEMRTVEGQHGYDVEITTSNGMKAVTTKAQLEESYPGMSTQAIADAMDREQAEIDAVHDEQEAPTDAEDVIYGYEDDQDSDFHGEPDEDPLAGDVDRWVRPNETKDFRD